MKRAPKFSDVVRAALADAVKGGRTQTEIAEATGIDLAVISKFRRGEVSTRLSAADKLAQELGVRAVREGSEA